MEINGEVAPGEPGSHFHLAACGSGQGHVSRLQLSASGQGESFPPHNLAVQAQDMLGAVPRVTRVTHMMYDDKAGQQTGFGGVC